MSKSTAVVQAASLSTFIYINIYKRSMLHIEAWDDGSLARMNQSTAFLL